MKKKYNRLQLSVMMIMLLMLIIPRSVFANFDEYDPIEEKMKHDLVYDTHSTKLGEENSLEIYNEESATFDEENGSLEYRLADEQTAQILKDIYEKNGDAVYSQYLYDITISFEKEHRIEAMYKMLEVYDFVSDDNKQIFDSYLMSYAPYTGDLKLIEQVNNKIDKANEVNIMAYRSSSDYDRKSAADWAYDYYYVYNSNYPNLSYFGGDCANFVSQAMHIGGGMPMTGDWDWYCYRKNTTYPEPKSVYELNYSWTLADPSPWISAKKFKDFWSSTSRSTTYTYDMDDYKNGNTDAYREPIYRGHGISLLKRVAWWYEAKHTMIVVGYDTSNSDYIYAAHSVRTRDGRVKDVGDYDQVMFYVFK